MDIGQALELGALNSFEVEQLKDGRLVLKKYRTIYLDPDNKIECKLYSSRNKSKYNITLNFSLPEQEVQYYTLGLRDWLNRYNFRYNPEIQVYELNSPLVKKAIGEFISLDRGYRVVNIIYNEYAVSVSFSRPPLDKQKALLSDLGLSYDRGRKLWILQVSRTLITENYIRYLKESISKQEGLIVGLIRGGL